MAPDPVIAEASDLAAQCELLRSLHVPGSPLVLPNAWDVPSAQAVAAAGFPAVATSSGGVAASLGYADHEGAPAREMLTAAARMAQSVAVPVTVDAESGYGLDAAVLVDTLRAAGVAGCNVEDTDHATGSLRDPGEGAARLAAIRRAADDVGYPLVLNARIDVFLAEQESRSRGQGDLLPAALERARAYLAAGADCVFPIGLWEEETIAELTAGVGAPVNVLATPVSPPLAALAALGVARISYGSLLHRHVLKSLERSLRAIAAGGNLWAAR